MKQSSDFKTADLLKEVGNVCNKEKEKIENSSFMNLSESDKEKYLIAYRTYYYGFSMIIVNETMRTSTNVASPDYSNGHAPINQVGYCNKLRDASYTDVVRPNVDTLYDPAWMDLSNGPLVLNVPQIEIGGKGRYYLLPMMDAYSNIFCSPGTRTGYTSGPYTFFIKGPNDTTETPDGMELIQAPTNLVWMLGRIYTTGTDEDITAVNNLQAQIMLTPAAQYPRNQSGYTPPTGVVDTSLNSSTPLQRVQGMGYEDFVNKMMQLWVENPPSMAPNSLGKQQDEVILQQMNTIGIEYSDSTPITWSMGQQGQNFSQDLTSAINKIPNQVSKELTFMKNHAGAPSITMNMLKQKIELELFPEEKKSNNNWIAITNRRMGNYQSHYMLRTFIAFSGLGANLRQDAIYPAISIPQTSTNTYTITFQNDIIKQPPVNNAGFWSLTMYGNNQELVQTPSNSENITNLYSVGSRSSLTLKKLVPVGDRYIPGGTEGKVIIFVQPEMPTDPMLVSNWLPAPTIPHPADETIALMLRFYWPNDDVLQSEWEYPVVTPTNNPV